ncbi:acyltransferase [Longispora fulva]|uniref:Peptidoglycan/LPS O-acetylase OafA/YrhL n=1 Tax=Longispora fulva TaxID=619741 RepID=A0A8J7KQG9_9ACTN|nr:acyltransferase [Longispora fulva]MBG6137397.1 peptidoglycan/LPS O-acetylase OafA/YrhL [Longispora fulva]GIG61249.1 acyltransferase [Longispora fulva]
MSAEPAAPGPAARRLHELDLLRIGAAVAVVVFHYTFSGWMQGHSPARFPGLGQVSRYGYLGVDLFFVISGFVVSLSAWGRPARGFVVSRIVRLYPAFWVAVTLTALVSVASGRFRVGFGQYLANLTMLNPVAGIANIDVVYWTLWAEIRFYLLVFVLAVVGLTRRRVLLALWAWLAVTAATQLGLLPGFVDLLGQSTFAHYFVAGMALGVIHRSGMTWELGVILALCWGNALYRGAGFAAGVGERYRTGFSTVVVCAVITAIFVVMILVALRRTESLGRPWMAHAGALTYPLYLAHAHLGFVVLAWLGPTVNRYVLVVGLMVAMGVVAWGIHAWVERPVAPRLRGLFTRAPGRRAGRIRSGSSATGKGC